MRKYNQRLGNKVQTDSDQRGGRKGITWKRSGRRKQRNTNTGLMGMNNGSRLTVRLEEDEQ